MKLKLATRGSRLALIQANIVKTALEKNGATVELIIASTKGDRDQKSPINAIGGRGLFVKEIEQYLLDGHADIAVHSGKDLPLNFTAALNARHGAVDKLLNIRKLGFLIHRADGLAYIATPGAAG